jgi:para-nitrobenzyl esterase
MDRRAMRAAIVATGAALLWLAIASPARAALAEPVRLQSGRVSGMPGQDPSITVFKGLPYAAPPVGKLRWRAPQPPARWQGVREADEFGPICPQPAAQGVPGQQIREDCLYLNVWTGARSAAERRPVMLWIHGAGAANAGSHPLYDGEALAQKGVVVVTINYRLGALGGLALPELSRESGHAASGNYGLLDDIAALQWVQKNIAAFGGDAKNVTLFGYSYGAGSQHMLAMSPLARGLFRRMITESHAKYARDPVLFQVAMSYQLLQEAEAEGQRFAERLGARSLQELRAIPWQRLVEGPGAGGGKVVDGWVVPHNYSETYARGAQHDVLVIAGFNKDETGAAPEAAFERIRSRPAGPGNNNVPRSIASLADYQSFARQRFGPMADEFLALYPASGDLEAFRANNDAIRDNARVSLWMWATSWRQRATRPVYLYYWTHAPPGRNRDSAGAYHGSEIAYAFNHPNLPNEPWTDEDRAIGETLSSYWTNFARNGDPNGPGLPRWPAFDAKSEQVMELGGQFAPIPLADRARVDFWQRFYATQPAR